MTVAARVSQFDYFRSLRGALVILFNDLQVLSTIMPGLPRIY